MNKVILFSRISIFIIYFWFGILKLFNLSPANSLVEQLLQKTLPFMPFNTFIIIFGISEILIGVVFLVKGLEKLAITSMFLHLFATVLPIILLPQIAWQKFLVPTLEGQYIIKNLVLIATALNIYAQSEYNQKQTENPNINS